MTSPKVYAHQILTLTGPQTVAQLVEGMQRNGTPQVWIDRWIQGLELRLRLDKETE